MDEPIDAPQISKEEEYLNSWKRAQADLINYKKEEMQRMMDLIKFGNEALILEILDVTANLELATKHIPDEGLKSIIKQFESLLKKYGVERIAIAGQKFDPTIHEAVRPLADGADLVEERPGYTMHGKVIRPARVNTTI